MVFGSERYSIDCCFEEELLFSFNTSVLHGLPLY